MYSLFPDGVVIAQVAGLDPTTMLFYVTVVASITIAGAVAVVSFVTLAPQFSSSWADQLGDRVDEEEATDYREVIHSGSDASSPDESEPAAESEVEADESEPAAESEVEAAESEPAGGEENS